MNRPADVDQILTDWLAEGPSQLPDHAINNLVRQLDDTKRRGSSWLPRRETMTRLLVSVGGVAAALIVAAVGIAYFYGPLGPGGPTGPVHTSERHGYSVVLPDDSWGVIERQGRWLGVGTAFDSESPGVDLFDRTDPEPRTLISVWVTSQPLPEGMSFDEWMDAHDRSNQVVHACFRQEGSYEYRTVDGERARIGVHHCPDWGGPGIGWATVQVLVAHEGRAYAAYLWPEEDPEMESLFGDLKAQGLRWLSRFSFTD
jgi:hypothetical protein